MAEEKSESVEMQNTSHETKDELSEEVQSNKNNNKSDTVSAFVALFQNLLFGVIIQVSTQLTDMKYTSKAGVCMFAASCLSNIFITLCKLECTLTFIIVNAIFIGSTVFLMAVIKNINMTYSCVIFGMYGIGVGMLMNVCPVYMAMASSDKYRVFLLNSIGGLGIVLGLIVGNNMIYFVGVMCAHIFLIVMSNINILWFLFMAKKVKIPGKLKMDNFGTIFRKGKNSVMLVVITMIANNIVGINYIVFNTPEIFNGSADSKHTGIIYFNICNFLSIAMTYGSYFLNNYLFGRKIAFLGSGLVVLLGNILFCLTPLEMHKWVSFLFILGFNSGVAAIPFIIMVEVFPVEVIQEGCMIGNVAYWVGGILSMVVFDPLSMVGFGVAIGYTAAMLIYWVLFFKETKGQAAPDYQPNKMTLKMV